MSFQDRRKQADRLRAVPLKAVLLSVGAQADPRDPAKWHTAMGVLSVNGMKFINWKQGAGGGGAIDLVMHLHGMDFAGAIRWLAQRFSPSPVSDYSQPPASELTLPATEIVNLPRVIRYLAGQRRLPHRLLDALVRDGRIYADARANAVFLLLGNENKAVGAELRGTTDAGWRGLAPGSRKNLGYFSVGPVHARDVVLCESAIDAISCAALYPECLCISTAGARPNPAWLHTLLDRGLRIRCGFDADTTGDQMAQAMIAAHPTIQRLRPSLHDWNDILTAFL
jgi:hypothetical protein